MADFIYVNPEYEQHLRQIGLLNLEALLGWSEGECVGEHDRREVRRIKLPGFDPSQTFYLRKDYRIAAGEILGELVRLVRPTSRCYKTMRAADWLDRAGIDTMQLVCLIERRYLGLPTKAAAIVTEVGGVDLYRQLAGLGRANLRTDCPPERTQLLYELGQLIWRIHQAKLTWPDCTAKHFSVSVSVSVSVPAGLPKVSTSDDSPAENWKLALIDVENMQKKFSPAERRRQFDQLLLSLRGLLTGTDVLRIMIGYLGAERVRARSVRRRGLEKFFPNGFDCIDRARRERKMLDDLPEDRPLPEEELYIRSGSITVNQRFSELLKTAGLPFDDKIFTLAAGSELHKPNLKGRFRYRFELRDHEDRPLWLYLKRTTRPALADQLRRIVSGTLRHSSCWHERYMIKRLAALRIPVPLVVAYGEKMLLGYERASVMITEGIVGQSLERFVPKHFPRSVNGEQLTERREWVRQVAGIVQRLHRANYCHRDLYLAHVFISFEGNGRPRFYLIDLGRCFKMRFHRTRWIVKDLAALQYSSRNFVKGTDQLRFLVEYLGVKKLDKKGKLLIRRVTAKADRIARHDQRNRRVTEERPSANGLDHRTS